MGDWWVSSTVIIHKYEFSGTAQILDIPLNLASPMLPTSASCMKTFQFTLQNWRNNSILGQTGDSGQFHLCCCLQIIYDIPLCKYLNTSVTIGHLRKYSNVAVSAKKISTHRMCEMCESSLCKKISTENLWKNHPFFWRSESAAFLQPSFQKNQNFHTKKYWFLRSSAFAQSPVMKLDQRGFEPLWPKANRFQVCPVNHFDTDPTLNIWRYWESNPWPSMC